MGLPKGRTNNPKGRPRKPNKVTRELRDRIKLFLDSNFETVQNDFKNMDPDKRVLLYEKLLKYCLPQLQTTDVILDFDKMTESQLDEIIFRILNKKQ